MTLKKTAFTAHIGRARTHIQQRARIRLKPCPLSNTILFYRTPVLFPLGGFGSVARHSSCTQFSAASRSECRQMTPRHVSSASGTKAGTTPKTFFKLRTLSFYFCPKGRDWQPLEARWRRKRPFRNSTALQSASRQLQSQMIGRGRFPTRFQIRRSGDCAADRERESYQAACP